MKFSDWLKKEIDLDDILYQCSLDNVDKKKWNLKDDGLIPEPIGVCGKIKMNDLNKINTFVASNKINSKQCYYGFSCQTDKQRLPGGSLYEHRPRNNPSVNRSSILKTLNGNGFNNTGVGYIEGLCQAKFAPSPEGNGIDCHRHWEALYCKSIPIIEDNDEIKFKFDGLPVLYTKDYSEITPDYLTKKYQEILETDYDFRKLFLSNYSPEIQKRIIERSNYWCSKSGPVFYKNHLQ
tara:strand:+ start:1874 stop:2581 length:708 start_codon:yes stop_codon:yes gene_type:complete